MTPAAALRTLAAEVTDALVAAHRRRMRGEHPNATAKVTADLDAVLEHAIDVAAQCEAYSVTDALRRWDDAVPSARFAPTLAPWRERFVALLALPDAETPPTPVHPLRPGDLWAMAAPSYDRGRPVAHFAPVLLIGAYVVRGWHIRPTHPPRLIEVSGDIFAANAQRVDADGGSATAATGRETAEVLGAHEGEDSRLTPAIRHAIESHTRTRGL